MKGNENSYVQSIRLMISPTQGDIVSTLQKCLKNTDLTFAGTSLQTRLAMYISTNS
jgi:hypothetical protein